MLYLTTNKTCATRFIYDEKNVNLPVWERTHDDWSRRVKDNEVILVSQSKIGRALIFDHRLCHDVEPYDGAEGHRIIIRSDIIYKKI